MPVPNSDPHDEPGGTPRPGLSAHGLPAPTSDLGRGGAGLTRAVTAAITGTVIEWYDYALYGAAAGLVIGPLFFPNAVPSAAALAAFATFAVGFVVRPLGGIIIGHIGDRVGRKPAMMLSIILMGVATVGIGVLPTSAALGVWAPVLLIVLRVLQGFGAGAELAGAMTLVAEYASPRRRGFYTSLITAMPPAGIVLATLAFLGASRLPDTAFLSWAWRIPFLLSAILFLVALYIRSRLDETPEYQAVMEKTAEKEAKEKLPLAELFRRNTPAVIIGFFAITGHNALNYIMAAFSLSYMTSPYVGMSSSDALLSVTIGSVFGILGPPIGGLMTDRFGAGKVMGFGALAGAIFAYPLFLGLQSGSVVTAAATIAIGYGIVIGATAGSQGALLTNIFPTASRYTGVAVAREINSALVAGLTPLIALSLIQAAGGQIWLSAGYLALCCLLSLGAVVVARGRGDRDVDEPTMTVQA